MSASPHAGVPASAGTTCRWISLRQNGLPQCIGGQLEFLDTLSAVDLGRVDVAFGIDRHRVNPVKLPGVAAAAAEGADDRAVLALEHPDLVVLAIGAQQISLSGIGPDRDVPNRAVAERILLEEPLLDEGAVPPKHLDAIVHAVADIDQTVIGDLHAMHGIGELLRDRRLGIVRRLLVVAWRLAVSAPMPLVSAGGGVEHDDAVIAVAVGDIDLVGILVDRGFGRLAELRGVVAAPARRDLADLHHELAVEREFQNGVVVVGIAADPDKSLLVDFDAMLAPDPLIALAGTAPRAQQIAVGIEFQHRRRRRAAFRTRRCQRRAFLVVGERARTMDHPDMSLPVHGDAADLPEDPVVRQWLWPGCFDRKSRDVASVSGRRKRGRCDQNRGPDQKGKRSAKTCGTCAANAILNRRHGILPCYFVAVFAAYAGQSTVARFGSQLWDAHDRCLNSRHRPRTRPIQYAAASRVNHDRLWNTGSPLSRG